MQPFLRWLSVLAAFLALWALLEQATRWLEDEVPGLSQRTLLLLLAAFALGVVEMVSVGGGRTPWKPSADAFRGAGPWIAILGLAAIAYAQRDLLRALFDAPEFRLPDTFQTAIRVVVFAPLVAELGFRGVLWRIFGAAAGARGAAIAALLGSTAAHALFSIDLFASSQFPRVAIANLATPALFGLGLGLVRQGTGGILPGLILHALFALLLLLLH